MLNRRKQYAGDEREALLGASSPENNPQSIAGAFIDIGQIAQLNDATSPGYSTNLTNLHLTAAQHPVQRKTRDKSPEARHNNLVNRYSDSGTISFSNIGQRHFRNETHEIQLNGVHHSRAVDLSLSHDSFRHNSQADFIYYTVQPGDTLQNLSFKYSCPVASIKRLNNLWSDQEFYGLTRLKLPAGKLRLIADVIDAEQTSKKDTSNNSTDGKSPSSSSALQRSTVAPSNVVESDFRGVHHYNELKSTNLEPELQATKSSDSIFKDYDLNIEKARTAALSYEDNASLIMQTLAQSGNIIDDSDELAQGDAEILLYDMTDYGLSYNGLLLFIFIVCLICPLAYVIYLEETHHDSNKAS